MGAGWLVRARCGTGLRARPGLYGRIRPRLLGPDCLRTMPAMNSLSDARDSSRRLPRRAAALSLALLLGVLALGAGAWLVVLQDAGGLSLAVLVLTAFCSGLLLLLVAGLGWHVGVRLTRQRMHEALRESRQHGRLLAQLQPAWQWSTDARHHLVRWQGPHDALSSHWVGASGAGSCESLWARFELDGEGAAAAPGLQQLLDGQPPEFELPVRARSAGGERWLLRGLARWDGQGRFDGYLGSATPRAQPKLAEPAELPSLSGPAAWLEALPGPAWLLDGESAPRLLAQNLQASALGQARLSPGDAWSACLERLPVGLAQSLHQQLLRPYQDGERRYALLMLPPAPLLAEPVPVSVPVQQLQASPAELSEHESFSYTVSHDLRAPLRVVEGFARILKEDYGRLLDRIGNDHLDRVMGAAARMNSMIDSLLSLAQLSAQPLACQPVDLSQLAGYVVEELRRSAPERLVSVHVQAQMVAQGDPTLLRMVLENLLGNAWKYSGKCAQAQIRFEAQQELPGGPWIYRISDNGAGFDMRFADRLFGVFQRLHSASDFQGTGVGLASVRRIVRRHGGEIWAESAVGEGARFYFTLPG